MTPTTTTKQKNVTKTLKDNQNQELRSIGKNVREDVSRLNFRRLPHPKMVGASASERVLKPWIRRMRNIGDNGYSCFTALEKVDINTHFYDAYAVNISLPTCRKSSKSAVIRVQRNKGFHPESLSLTSQ